MAYSELIKNHTRTRRYLREFLVYGFKNRNEYEQKSARSYDDEKRRIESWLDEYISFRQDASGKSIFISMNSRQIDYNPFYRTWKSASFTKNDITLHFWLLDILSCTEPKTIAEIFSIMEFDYASMFLNADFIDESTLRKKLREYVNLGLIHVQKEGKQNYYYLPQDELDLSSWQSALTFFSEESPLGVIGSYLLDKYPEPLKPIFSSKHHYLLFALDSGIMLDLLSAIHAHQCIELEFFTDKKQKPQRLVTFPVKIFSSTQGGRQYLAGIHAYNRNVMFYRLDNIQRIKVLGEQTNFEEYLALADKEFSHIWGVSTRYGRHLQLQHIEMCLCVQPYDMHIVERLEREKRCGTITQVEETKWLFSADVYDATELLPWLRTFMGRIISLSCSNRKIEQRFWHDYHALLAMYGEKDDVIS